MVEETKVLGDGVGGHAPRTVRAAPHNPVAPILRQDGNAKFLLSVLARKVGCANNRKIGIRGGENGIA